MAAMLWDGPGRLEENGLVLAEKVMFRAVATVAHRHERTYDSVNQRWWYWKTDVPLITTTVAELIWGPGFPRIKGDHGKIFKASQADDCNM